MKTAGIILLLATTCLASDRALIMTGGYSWEQRSSYATSKSVEVYHPGTNTVCSLPSLPKSVVEHSQDGFVLCGGRGGWSSRWSLQSCHTLNTDTAQWTKTHSLRVERAGLTSWRREDADGSILLLGGGFTNEGGKTTELVSDSSGVSSRGFTLKYLAKNACSITDTSSVVITGGGNHRAVSRYDRNGWVEFLPSLLTARRGHGCAQYTTDTGDKVYMVMGGYDEDNNRKLSSTETLKLGDSAWRESTALPRPLSSLRAATLDNTIYITGGHYDGKSRDEIYKLKTGRRWEKVARMKTPRHYHGLSVIKYSEVEGICH